MATTQSSHDLPKFYYDFQPATWWIGIIDAPTTVVANEAIVWIRSLGQWVKQKHLSGHISTMLSNLEPFLVDKTLLVSVAGNRTAVFRNALSDGVTDRTSALAYRLHCCSTRINYNPNTFKNDDTRQQRNVRAYGATILEIHEVNAAGEQPPVRSIAAVNDAGTWRFEQFGKPFDFEDLSAYQAKKKSERFTPTMLMKYCAALGIPVYDESFYGTEGVMILESPTSAAKSFSFKGACEFLGVAT